MPSGEQKAFEYQRLPPQQLSLRWRDTASVLVPPGPIDTRSYEISPIPDDTTARQFIERHHYSGEYVPARFRFGLYHRSGELHGVAVFSVPMNYHSFDRFQLRDRNEGAELARLVLLDQTGGNAESLFVAQCFRYLRRDGIRAIVAFSDPVPRTTIDGRQTLIGHIGVVYQACSAVYTGRSKSDTLRLLPDGKCYHRRAMQKIRAQETGWKAEVEKLQSYGAGPLDRAPRAWVDFWLPKITRPLHHPGNHRYAWALDRWARRALGEPNPGNYPVPAGGRVAPKYGRRVRSRESS